MYENITVCLNRFSEIKMDPSVYSFRLFIDYAFSLLSSHDFFIKIEQQKYYMEQKINHINYNTHLKVEYMQLCSNCMILD